MKQRTGAAFGVVPQVVYVFHYLLNSADTFSVFTEGNQYDDSLMDDLLDVEWELMKELPEAVFYYMPVIGGEIPDGWIPESATRVYQRQ